MTTRGMALALATLTALATLAPLAVAQGTSSGGGGDGQQATSSSTGGARAEYFYALSLGFGTYDAGGNVTLRGVNQGERLLNGTFEFEVHDPHGAKWYYAYVFTELAPGGTLAYTWSGQRSPLNGTVAPLGNYTGAASFKSGTHHFRSEGRFAIVPAGQGGGPPGSIVTTTGGSTTPVASPQPEPTDTPPSPPVPPSPPPLMITTTQARHAPGETVVIQLWNRGSTTLNGTPTVEVRTAADGRVVMGWAVAQVIRSLHPGENITFTWNGREHGGDGPVLQGTFEAKGSFAGHGAVVRFTIGEARPEPTPPADPQPVRPWPGPLGVTVAHSDAGWTFQVHNRGDRPLRGELMVGVLTRDGSGVWRQVPPPAVEIAPGGTSSVSWDGKDTRGVPVHEGCYVVLATLAGLEVRESFAVGPHACPAYPRPAEPTTPPRPAEPHPGPAEPVHRPSPVRGAILGLSADTYAPGERVTLRITNPSAETVRGDAVVEIRDPSGLRAFALLRERDLALVGGASIRLDWDQRGRDGALVGHGCYLATAHYGPFVDAKPFGIRAEGCARARFDGSAAAPPPTWEQRASDYWERQAQVEARAEVRAAWPHINDQMRDLAREWRRDAAAKEAVLRSAEDKGLFGAFEYQADTGAVTGPHLRFAYHPEKGAIEGLEVRRGGTWARLAEGIHVEHFGALGAPVVGGPVFLHEGQSAVVMAHQGATAPLAHRALQQGNLVAYVLAPGVRAEPLGPHVLALRGEVHAMVVLMGPGTLEVHTEGDKEIVVARLRPHAGVMLMALGLEHARPFGQPEAHEAIARGVASGTVGAEMTLVGHAGGGGSAGSVVPYRAVEMRAKDVQRGRVLVEVSSELPEGKAVVLNLDAALLAGGRLVVLYDGAPIGEADDLADALTLSPGEGPEYYVAHGRGGAQVIVQVPHFSVHTVEIQSFEAEIVQGLVTAGLLGGIALVAVLGALMLRNHRFKV